MKKSKKDLRNKLRAQRRALTPQLQRQASDALLNNVIKRDDFQNAMHLAMYLDNDGEVSMSQIIDYCWRNNKQVYLPVLHPFCKGYLIFCRYTPDTVMVNNRFGIPEPKANCATLIPVSQLDLIFTPLVGFDQLNQRIGMGGGFYDRTLATLYKHSIPSPIIGVAHRCQKVDSLPCEPWDLAMKEIIAV